jgi:hypothetical protein
VGYKNLGVSNFFKSLFYFFENQLNNNNNIFNICIIFLNIKNNDIESSEYPKNLNPIKFQYEEFKESDKSNLEII